MAGRFGKGLAGTPLTTLLYSGEQTDAATGLQYLRARYYDPRTGRFNRLNPFAGNINDPQSLHKYLYAHANPVLGSDPSGMETLAAQLSVTGIQSSLATFANPASMAALYYASAVTFSISAASLIHLTLPFVVEGIEAGIDGAGKLAAEFIERASEYAEAVTQAIVEVAAATAIAIEELRRLPIFPIVKSNGPNIYDFDVEALAANPRWFLLSYLGAGNLERKARNRAEVERSSGLGGPRPEGMQLDEFPYASTREGGRGAWGRLVPAWENQKQGLWLSIFYGVFLNFKPGRFVVVPVPF